MAKNTTKSATINMRVEPEVKAQAEDTFAAVGMTLTEAVNVFLYRSIEVGGLPFSVRTGGMEPSSADVAEQLAQALVSLQGSQPPIEVHVAAPTQTTAPAPASAAKPASAPAPAPAAVAAPSPASAPKPAPAPKPEPEPTPSQRIAQANITASNPAIPRPKPQPAPAPAPAAAPKPQAPASTSGFTTGQIAAASAHGYTGTLPAQPLETYAAGRASNTTGIRAAEIIAAANAKRDSGSGPRHARPTDADLPTI